MLDNTAEKERGFSDDGFDEESLTDKQGEVICEHCGSETKWFIHMCKATIVEEIHGCSKCDDHCIYCK